MTAAQAGSGRFMIVFGAAVVAGAVLWVLFTALDTFGLEDRRSAARVVAKGFRAAGKTYVTQIVGNRPVVLPQATPEMYLLTLALPGGEVECAVDKALHDGVRPGDEVRVTYRKRRIRGTLMVVRVER